MSGQLKLNNLEYNSESPSFERKESVIQCTFCQTKYSVPYDSVHGLNNPKFHCFRCDSIFAVEVDHVLPQEPEENFAPDSFEQENVSAEKTDSDSEWTLGFNSALKVKSKSTPPEWSLPQKEAEKSEQKSFSFSLKPNFVENYLDGIREQEDFNPYEENEFIIKEEKVKKEKKDLSLSINVSKVTALVSTKMFVCAALFTLLFLFCIQIYADRYPDKMSFLFSPFITSAVHVPPAGAGVRELNINKVELDNGQSLSLIEGEIYNNSSSVVDEIKLEGLVFDDSGNILLRQRVDLGSNINDIKISSLDIAEITRIQNESNLQLSSLQPGETKAFAIAMLSDSTASESIYYSARIYSVK